jgi:hypothetical protein
MKVPSIRIMSGLLLMGAGLVMSFPHQASAQRSRDFLFGEPHFSLAFNMGYGVPKAGSDIYDFITNELTVEKKDFYSMLLGGSFGVRVTNRVELSLDISYANSNTRSENRLYVDQDDLPIEQSTRLSRMPVTGTVKAFLFERGRKISQLAWVPGQWSPFVGAGGGRVYYNFRQSGDFVDYETLEIFSDTFRSKGNAGIFHVLAGAEWSLSPRFYLTGEGRYSWAEAKMDRDFVGFEPIDLSGFQGTVGLALRF